MVAILRKAQGPSHRHLLAVYQAESGAARRPRRRSIPAEHETGRSVVGTHKRQRMTSRRYRAQQLAGSSPASSTPSPWYVIRRTTLRLGQHNFEFRAPKSPQPLRGT
jgi:hypothetical protein